jgi:hypothetical protein
MPKKPTIYSTDLEKNPSKTIYININYLEKGDYELKIIFKNKLISKTHFKK